MRKKIEKGSSRLLLLRIGCYTFVTLVHGGQSINNLITNSHGKKQKTNPWKIKAEQA